MSYTTIQPSAFSIYKADNLIVGGGFIADDLLPDSHVFHDLAVPLGLFTVYDGGEKARMYKSYVEDEVHGDVPTTQEGGGTREEHQTIPDELYEKLIGGATEEESHAKTRKNKRHTSLKKGTATVKRSTERRAQRRAQRTSSSTKRKTQTKK